MADWPSGHAEHLGVGRVAPDAVAGPHQFGRHLSGRDGGASVGPARADVTGQDARGQADGAHRNQYDRRTGGRGSRVRERQLVVSLAGVTASLTMAGCRAAIARTRPARSLGMPTKS